MTKKSATSIPGIYLITNTMTGKVYVGQAVNIRRRWESHRHYLAANGHRNCHLQRSWNKRGAEAFEFSVYRDLSYVPKESIKAALDTAEIEALREFPINYNLMEAGFSAPIAGEETRAIWSAQRTEMWAREGFRESRSEATKALYANLEWKAARDAAVKAGLSTPEAKVKASKRFTAMWQDPEHKAIQSAKRIANWQDPDYCAKQRASRIASHARRKAAKLAASPAT